MADNLAPVVQEATSPTSSHAVAGTVSAANANHGYTSATYVSRYRSSQQPSGASSLQGSYSSQPMRSTPHGYPSTQQPSRPSPSNPAASQGFVSSPSRPIISSPVRPGPPTTPATYPQTADPYPGGVPRYPPGSAPRPAPTIGAPMHPGRYGPLSAGPTGPPGYFNSPPNRPMVGVDAGHHGDYTRGPVRPQPPPPPPYTIRQDGSIGPGGGGPGPGIGQSMGPGTRSPTQSQATTTGYSRFSTQSLSGWEHEGVTFNGNGPSNYHPNVRPPPAAAWNDNPGPNGMGPLAGNHRRTVSTQVYPTYNGSQYPPSATSTYQVQPPYPANRRHPLNEAPASPILRLHNAGTPNEYYYNRKLSITDSLDGSRMSMDSTTSMDSVYSRQQPLYTPPNMYGRDGDMGMEGFRGNRERSLSKSSVFSARSINSDYYADFDSTATPNGSTPQISIQSAQGYGRPDPFTMRARTPSPGRIRQGSNPPSVSRAGTVCSL